MKRMRWLALGTAALTAATLAGCSSSAPGEGGTTATELTVWVMGDSSAHFDALVKPFEDKTGIDVKTVAIPWDSVDQKFTTAVASGDGPDVLQIGLSKLRTYADSGALLTLDEATLSGHENLAASRFVDGVAGDATAIGGKVVSVPWVSDTRVLFYRSDILEAAGISTPPATWDQLRADAKTLAGRGDGSYGYYIPQWDSALPVIMTWDQGGDIVDGQGKIDFDTPAFGKAVDLYTGLYADKSVPTNSDFDQTQGFITGSTPMLVSGPYLAAAISQSAPELAGKWNVTTVPSGAKDTSLLAGSNLGVWGSTKNKDGALQLLDYLSQPDVQVSWYQSDGQLPTVKAALTDSALTSDPMVSVYTKQLASSRLLPLVPNWDGETGKALLDSLNSIVLTGANRDEALTTLFTTTAGTPGPEAMKNRIVPYTFIAPAMLLLIVFGILPIAVALLVSFTDMNLAGLGNWSRIQFIGADNYTALFADPDFWQALGNTALFAVVGVPSVIVLSLTIALALNRSQGRFFRALRSFYFVPAITAIVAVALVWGYLYNTQFGLFNYLLSLVGLPPVPWLSDPTVVKFSVGLVAVWRGLGLNVIIFLAALQGVPKEYLEAAAIDGASGLRRIFSIVLPLLRFAIFFVTITTVIAWLQFFDEPFVLTKGGPLGSSTSIALFLYQKGFSSSQFGYASAGSVVLVAIIATITIVQLRLRRSDVDH